jgi:hypothetical protein
VAVVALSSSGCLVAADELSDGGVTLDAGIDDAGPGDAGDCRLGTFLVEGDVFPKTGLIISSAGDGGFVCQLGTESRTCGDGLLGFAGFFVYFDDAGYEILDFNHFGCTDEWAGTMLEMEIAGQPVPRVTAHRQ